MRMIIGGGCEWLLCGKCNGLAADVRIGDIQTTDMPDVVRACTCPDRPKKFPLEKPMTDFDQKLAELRKLTERPVMTANVVVALEVVADLISEMQQRHANDLLLLRNKVDALEQRVKVGF